MLRRYVLTLAALNLAFSIPAGAQSITTTTKDGDIGDRAYFGNYNFGGEYHAFGVGQLFKAPTHYYRLDAVRFWMGTDPCCWLPGWKTGQFNYRAYIFAWNEESQRPVPGSIWKSAPTDFMNFGGPYGGWAPLDFVTGGLRLAAGHVYAAMLLSIGEDYEADPPTLYEDFLSSGRVNGIYTPPGTKPGDETLGILQVGFSGDTETALQGMGLLSNEARWSAAGADSWDIGFDATFSLARAAPPVTATPEPATLALFATGFLALAGAGAHRKYCCRPASH